MSTEKEFLMDEFLTFTLVGSLTRGIPIYKKNTTERQKEKFRNCLKNLLRKYAKQYYSPVCEDDHIRNLLSFQVKTEKFTNILLFDKLKIGRVQKLLNLYLKYLWVWGEISKPPHCPFDSIIITKLKLKIAWTDLDDIDRYRLLVRQAKKIANGQDLADWELEFWNKNLIE